MRPALYARETSKPELVRILDMIPSMRPALYARETFDNALADDITVYLLQ